MKKIVKSAKHKRDKSSFVQKVSQATKKIRHAPRNWMKKGIQKKQEVSENLWNETDPQMANKGQAALDAFMKSEHPLDDYLDIMENHDFDHHALSAAVKLKIADIQDKMNILESDEYQSAGTMSEESASEDNAITEEEHSELSQEQVSALEEKYPGYSQWGQDLEKLHKIDDICESFMSRSEFKP